jgi:hypothetical protein|tara:strand:+ start:94788 stop:94955 length:168 start_codon:yes stop_codon:yes gene_type:complete
MQNFIIGIKMLMSNIKKYVTTSEPNAQMELDFEVKKNQTIHYLSGKRKKTKNAKK